MSLRGLSKRRKSLPCRWLYDERGSELFEQITQLEEYYPTRVETGILRANAAEMAGFVGKGATLIEYGAGAGIKTEILIAALQAPRLYVPVDISGDYLDQAVISLRHRFPDIGIWPIVADFTGDFDIPAAIPLKGRSAFFPGSTIGNLDHGETVSFLRRIHRHVGAKGTAVIGADLTKDIRVLRAAYNDRQGVTAAFNTNLLTRINRELDGDFRVDRFAHEARWNSMKFRGGDALGKPRSTDRRRGRAELRFRAWRVHPHGNLPQIRCAGLFRLGRKCRMVYRRNVD